MDRRERKERKGKGRGGLKGGTEFAPPPVLKSWMRHCSVRSFCVSYFSAAVTL